MAPQEFIFYEPVTSGNLHQGEVLSNVILAQLDPASLHDPIVNYITHPYAIVLSQECDLYWDFRGRSEAAFVSKKIPQILFCEVITAETLRGREGINAGLWKHMRENKDERYHFLQKVEPPQDGSAEGIPELGIDFKRYFTLSTEELYKRIENEETKRRFRLKSPYTEHLNSRFAHYISRVALPIPHQSE
ncbi:MAG: hypothetical protein ABIJ56_12950 [Pseudomonadota bacterium]